MKSRFNSPQDNSTLIGCSGPNRNGFSKAELLSILSRHAHCTQKILAEIEAHDEIYFQTKGSAKAVQAFNMAREVLKEIGRAIQFARTQINAHAILSCAISLEHAIEDRLMEFWHERFPECVICLYNIRSRCCFIMDEKGEIQKEGRSLDVIVEGLSQKRPEHPLFADLAQGDAAGDIFKTFYESQLIESRANRRYFQQMIPNEWLFRPGLEVEHGFRNTKLEQFLSKKKKT
jgi:hypothetical protein